LGSLKGELHKIGSLGGCGRFLGALEPSKQLGPPNFLDGQEPPRLPKMTELCAVPTSKPPKRNALTSTERLKQHPSTNQRRNGCGRRGPWPS
jgi:hypothetical protein